MPPPPPPPPPRKFLKKDHTEIEFETTFSYFSCTCILQRINCLLVVHVQNLCCCIYILQKKLRINVLYSQFVDLARLNALVLSQHRLNYQLAIAKVSLVNSNRSQLTLKLSVCRTLLSCDFHSTFSSHCISTDYNHEMAILYLISYLHFANITFFSSLGRCHSCSQCSDCFFTTSTVTHNR